MDSPQSVVSSFKNLSVSSADSEKQRSEVFDRVSSHIANGTNKKGVNTQKPEDFVGFLDVCVHQARDIQNICIYHKQDVYAKIYLTSDPEISVTTKTINGGGQNPVFNETLQLDVRTIESSLKCEIWMLSRVKNYLEDQLLGFALVPLSEVLVKNGKTEKEFSLSSTDLFHSPAGFVQLTLSYSGALPEVIEISNPPQESEDSVLPADYDKIEFPDPKILSEDQMMVSEYFGITPDNVDSVNLHSVPSESESHELGVRVVESFSANSEVYKPLSRVDSPLSSVSTNGSLSVCLSTNSQSSETQVTSNSPPKDKKDCEPSKGMPIVPLVSVNIEPEEQMVQQDIVDMYMKSMQQFTDSLAKMNLPMNVESNSTKSDDSSSDQKTPKSAGSRVFYGSTAFF